MSVSGKDRVDLMESMGITVKDGTGGDNLYLGRYGIFIPYSITNFMLFSESYLVEDVLRRFREKQMDNPSEKRMEDWWAISRASIDKERDEAESLATSWERSKNEIELDDMLSGKNLIIQLPPHIPIINPITEKKQNIRNILTEKGLFCSESE